MMLMPDSFDETSEHRHVVGWVEPLRNPSLLFCDGIPSRPRTNPVKHALVKRVRDWASSSFQCHAEIGHDPIDGAAHQSESGMARGRQIGDGFRKSSTHPTSYELR
jgi:hypothetical protein